MNEALTVVLIAAFAAITIFAAWRTVKVVRYARLHHPIANKHFMARYRAERPQTAGPPSHAAAGDLLAVVEAPSPPGGRPPVVRRRNPADAGESPASASAGTRPSRRTR